MNRAQRRFEKFNAKRAKMTYAPIYRKRKIEDAHVEWLWRKIQSGMQLKFEITLPDGTVKRTMSHRTFDKLVSLQNRQK